MNIISGCKKLYHFTGFTLRLINKNLFLFGRLILLVTASMAAGIIIMPLLSYFDEGVRTVAWYIKHIALLVGLLVSASFVFYLIIHILAKQTESEVKRGEAEHKVRANEQEYADYIPYAAKPPILTRLLASAKTKLLGHDPGKNE